MSSPEHAECDHVNERNSKNHNVAPVAGLPDTSVMSQHPILFSRARQTAVVIMEAFPELENEKENYVLIFWPSDLNRIFME